MLTVITVENKNSTIIYRVYKDKDLQKIQEILKKYCFIDDLDDNESDKQDR